MKKLLSSLIVLTMASVSLFQAASAAFEETVTVAGTSFTVGAETGGGGGDDDIDTNMALKFLVNVGGVAESSNLTDSINGPAFDNIDELWTDQMVVKMHNQGDMPLDVISKSSYVNDPDVIRDDIYVDVTEWNDTNNDGVFQGSEAGVSYGYDTILRWRNDTFPLGEILAGETRGFVLTFDGTGVTESNIGHSAVYNFEFTGIEQAL